MTDTIKKQIQIFEVWQYFFVVAEFGYLRVVRVLEYEGLGHSHTIRLLTLQVLNQSFYLVRF